MKPRVALGSQGKRHVKIDVLTSFESFRQCVAKGLGFELLFSNQFTFEGRRCPTCDRVKTCLAKRAQASDLVGAGL